MTPETFLYFCVNEFGLVLPVSCDASSALVFLLLLSDIPVPGGFFLKGSADGLTVAVKVSIQVASEGRPRYGKRNVLLYLDLFKLEL